MSLKFNSGKIRPLIKIVLLLMSVSFFLVVITLTVTKRADYSIKDVGILYLALLVAITVVVYTVYGVIWLFNDFLRENIKGRILLIIIMLSALIKIIAEIRYSNK